jgi:hypothetical protein
VNRSFELAERAAPLTGAALDHTIRAEEAHAKGNLNCTGERAIDAHRRIEGRRGGLLPFWVERGFLHPVPCFYLTGSATSQLKGCYSMQPTSDLALPPASDNLFQRRRCRDLAFD